MGGKVLQPSTTTGGVAGGGRILGGSKQALGSQFSMPLFLLEELEGGTASGVETEKDFRLLPPHLDGESAR